MTEPLKIKRITPNIQMLVNESGDMQVLCVLLKGQRSDQMSSQCNSHASHSFHFLQLLVR